MRASIEQGEQAPLDLKLHVRLVFLDRDRTEPKDRSGHGEILLARRIESHRLVV